MPTTAENQYLAKYYATFEMTVAGDTKCLEKTV
jgi:hypothetical protein